MKKHVLKSLLGLALIAITFTFSGCDLFDKVDDVQFDVSLPLEFVINEEMVSSSPVDYSKNNVLDATDNADVAKYKDKIKSFKLNKVTYTISGFSAPGGSVTFSNGKLSVQTTGKKIAGAAQTVLAEQPNEVQLTDVDLAGFNEVAELLKNDKQITVTTSGTFSSTPVAFILTAHFHCTITAEVLK